MSQGNYLNIEFTADGKYMIWFEGVEENPTNGIVWHCAVNQMTGELIPPDGRGFRAFESTSWGRANPGYDNLGSYYIGSDREGKLIMVRPDGPDQGKIITLSIPADPRRRAIYPTNFTNREGGFVFFIQNEKTPGAGVRMNGNSWVELQYINLSMPAKIHIVERQETPRMGFAPMDVGFARWMRHRPIITYGYLSKQTGKVEIRAFDAENPEQKPFDAVSDGYSHIDPYPALIGEYEYIFTGIEGEAKSHIYRRPAGRPADTPFDLFKIISPSSMTRLATPSLAQSHEPFVLRDRLYTVYQINEKGRNFWETTFSKPGEIWLADLSGKTDQQWLIAPDDAGGVLEPEPLITPHGIWIFYNKPMLEETATAGEDDSQARRAGKGILRRLLGRQSGRMGSAGKIPRLALYRAEIPDL